MSASEAGDEHDRRQQREPRPREQDMTMTEPTWAREGASVREKATGHVWRIRNRKMFDDGPWFALCDDRYRPSLPTCSLAQLLDQFEPVDVEQNIGAEGSNG